ncbi:MAG TPA: hypothetical protein VMW89_18690 [Desulfatiglandales bacterium]|nr:hypothetical protein [Desulfatiglandales bacterium]
MLKSQLGEVSNKGIMTIHESQWSEDPIDGVLIHSLVAEIKAMN